MPNRTLLSLALLALLAAPVLAKAPERLLRPVAFQFQDEDVRVVLDALSKFTNVPIAVAPDVNGKVTMMSNKASACNCVRALAASVGAVAVPDGKGGVLVAKPLAAVPGNMPADRPVMFEFSNEARATVVNAIAQFASVNLVYDSTNLKGTVSLSAKNEPWRAVLERVLAPDYRLVPEGNILRIEPK